MLSVVAPPDSKSQYRLFLVAFQLLGTIDDGALTPEGQVLSVNQFGAHHLGYTQHDLIGHSVLKVIHPEDHPTVHHHLASCLLDLGTVKTWEFRKVRRDGSVLWVREMARGLHNDAQQPIILIVCEDITTRKIEADQLRLTQFTVDHAMDQVFWVDAQGRFHYVNEAACRRLGYSSTELLEMGVSDINPDFPHTNWPAYWERLKTQGWARFESRHKAKSGEIYPVEISSIYVNQIGLEYTCAFVRDISERTRTEARLRQAQKMEAIGTLAGGIAHDFNNILAAIVGYTELMRLNSDDPATRQNIGHIETAATRAKNLVKQILAFSRAQDENPVPLNIAQAIQDALALLRSTIPATIQIETRLSPEELTILADPTQLQQVLLNLGGNAAHSMQQRGGTLSIETTRHDLSEESAREYPTLKPGSYVRLRVQDTGCGIPSHLLPRIFDPFFTTKGPGEGTGLGLSMVHGIVTKYGGAITIESVEGEGTSIDILLPRHTAPTEELPLAPSRPLLGGTQHILVVDDEQPLTEMLRQLLERLGYRVTTANDPLAALSLVREAPERFDAVLTDQTMPGMTGSTLTVELLNIRPTLPIILISGFGNTVDSQKATQLGARAFLPKPIDFPLLFQLLQQVLGGETTSPPVKRLS
jgi:PAS domain S-box-containing protein